ncbi:MAG: nuclear transport factor 2 family protein [Ferruginibacter sp.]
MKKIFCLTGIGLVFLLLSCTDSTPKTGTDTTAVSQAETNKANNRAVMKAIDAGDAAVIDSLIAPDAVDHSGPNMTEIKGGDSIKSMLKNIHNSFTDLKTEIIADAAEGDYVFTLSRMTGTTTANPGMGMPPNTKTDMTAVDVVKFKDGKALEHWNYMDPKDMMKMMPGAGKMDSKAMDSKMNDKKK